MRPFLSRSLWLTFLVVFKFLPLEHFTVKGGRTHIEPSGSLCGSSLGVRTNVPLDPFGISAMALCVLTRIIFPTWTLVRVCLVVLD